MSEFFILTILWKQDKLSTDCAEVELFLMSVTLGMNSSIFFNICMLEFYTKRVVLRIYHYIFFNPFFSILLLCLIIIVYERCMEQGI